MSLFLIDDNQKTGGQKIDLRLPGQTPQQNSKPKKETMLGKILATVVGGAVNSGPDLSNLPMPQQETKAERNDRLMAYGVFALVFVFAVYAFISIKK